MKIKEMNRLTEHFDFYFGQKDPLVLHPVVEAPLHLDALLYEPNKPYPFWKLVTMGASDYKMPAIRPLFDRRNEYMLLIHPEVDLHDPAVANKYYRLLCEVALYPAMSKTALTYGHSIEWQPEEGEDTVGAYLELPQMIRGTGVLRCKLGIGKRVTCLQVIPLNREEMDRCLEVGPQAFSYFLYPDQGEGYYVRRLNEKKDV